LRSIRNGAAANLPVNLSRAQQKSSRPLLALAPFS
jgi:hypothetical protein